MHRRYLLTAILLLLPLLCSTIGAGASISQGSGEEEPNEYGGFVPSVVEDDEPTRRDDGDDDDDSFVDGQMWTRYFVTRRRTSEPSSRQSRVIRSSRGVRRDNAYFPPPTWPDSNRGAGSMPELVVDRSLAPHIPTDDFLATRLCGLRLTQKSREVCKDCVPYNLAQVALIEKRRDGMSSTLGRRYITPEKLTQKCCLRKCTVEDIRAACCGTFNY